MMFSSDQDMMTILLVIIYDLQLKDTGFLLVRKGISLGISCRTRSRSLHYRDGCGCDFPFDPC